MLMLTWLVRRTTITPRPGYDRLHINPATAEGFFATLDQENIIGLIGFLPVVHEYFDGDDSYNRSYQEQTSSVINRCDNKLIPFLTPQTHIGVTPNEYGHKAAETHRPELRRKSYPVQRYRRNPYRRHTDGFIRRYATGRSGYAWALRLRRSE